MPERFLLQVLRHLVTHGILHSTRGVDGGYSLERKPEEISLLEVIEAVDGPLALNWPTVENVAVAPGEKTLREALQEVANSSRRQLQAIKISDLLADPSHAKLA